MMFKNLNILVLASAILFSINSSAQVGINTETPDPSSILDIVDTSKGILIPRIGLTGVNDLSTIALEPTQTEPAESLLIYNTATAGTGIDSVSPGFYYYDGDKWVRIHDEGFDLVFEQTAQAQASNNPNTFIALPGLDTGNIQFPFPGEYKVVGTGYYSAGDQTGNGDGVGIASLGLEMFVNNVGSIVKERFVSAVSLDLGPTNRFDNLGQQVSYSFSFEANTTDIYRFVVNGREWNSFNTTEEGFFGKDTTGFARSNGQNEAYRGTLIVSLIQQF